MRKLRTIVIGMLALAAVPSIGRAQESRLFTDAWFWGAKAGAMTFSTTRVAHQTAPTIGAEWLLTRKKGGLYIAFDQATFTAHSTFHNFETNSTGKVQYAGDGEARIRNMQRVTFQGMVFPKEYGSFRPYAGAGFAVNFLGHTRQSAGPVTSLSDSSLRDVSSNAAPILTLGTQYSLRRLSVFGQGSYMPAVGHFLLNSNETYYLEGGVRYNIGTSIDRPR